MSVHYGLAKKRLRHMRALVREPLFVTPGHYYSPIASTEDAERAGRQRATLAAMDGIDLRPEGQLALAGQLGPYWPQLTTTGRRYRRNAMYDLADAAVYHSMLRLFEPRRIVEVGSGFSSAVALDHRDETGRDVDLTFVEPYPDRLLGLLTAQDDPAKLLIQRPVQDVDLAVFEALDDGDILFIDSSHVSKAGSDVNWLFFVVLPRLRPGVLVHVHDVFFPFDYPREWLAQRRAWNEDYLLRAFLTFNSQFRIELFNSWLWSEHPEVVRAHLPAAADDQPGGIWLRRLPAG